MTDLRAKFTENAEQFDALMVEMLGENETLKTEKAALAEALGELVFLKKMKDMNGKTPTYLEQKPKAWEAAMQVLDTLEA